MRDKNRIYEDMDLTVVEVDAVRRIIKAEAELFGTRVKIEMDADAVEVVKERE